MGSGEQVFTDGSTFRHGQRGKLGRYSHQPWTGAVMRTRLAVAALLLVPAALQGQSRFSVEVGAHAAVPIQDFGNAELETGLGFGANIRYRIQPHLAAYAGWEWQHFTTEVLATDLDVEETGYTFGLRFEHPFG